MYKYPNADRCALIVARSFPFPRSVGSLGLSGELRGKGCRAPCWCPGAPASLCSSSQDKSRVAGPLSPFCSHPFRLCTRPPPVRCFTQPHTEQRMKGAAPCRALLWPGLCTGGVHAQSERAPQSGVLADAQRCRVRVPVRPLLTSAPPAICL